MDILNGLQEAGLNKNEAKVYLSLLQSDSSMARALAYKTNMHRANVYDALYSLVSKGLVTFSVVEQKKHFKARPPESMMDFLSSKQKQFQNILPEIKRITSIKENVEKIYLSEGIFSLKEAIKNLLAGEEILFYGVPEKIDDRIIAFMQDFYKEAGKLKIKYRYLSTQKDEEWENELKKFKNLKIKVIEGSDKVSKLISENKVLIISWNKQPLVIEIDNKDIADFYRANFETLWKAAREV